ncbi:MAG TPA: TolC family protein [Gemmatimonadaceae bacterium]|jgi:outer membrane protein TolC|nr:TolC family protein [Gemmatimonadaceae bacterium]
MRRSLHKRPIALVTAALTLAAYGDARAQRAAPPRDTLTLAALQAAAVQHDPRARQLDLLASRSALREKTLNAERLPALGLAAQGQYQSDVPEIPLAFPGGVTPPLPPHDSYDAHLEAREPLYDPSRGARRGVERATLAESQARVRTALYQLRQEVSDAYFTALLLRAQRAELETAVADLEARLRQARDRVREGSALPSEQATLEAELLRTRQSLAELDANRGAALDVLGDLTGRTIGGSDSLALPDLADEVARARGSLDSLRARPEYEQFARTRDLLERQQSSVAAQNQPRVSAFGRAGYGRPALNPLGTEFDEYWLAGVRVEWSPFDWGSTGRQQEELALQRQIVATEESAFTERIRRGVASDLATVDRLERTLAADDTIIALRERVLDETRIRFNEGVVTSAEYVDRETDALNARLARASHRVELERARARFLTLTGVEVR